MVVLARLQWARMLVAGGAPAHISISSASVAGRGKFKILVFHGQPATSNIVRDLLVAQLDHVILQVRAYVAVDRGHRHVGTNASEIGIWLTPCPVPSARFMCHVPAPADDDVSEGADDDGDEGDVEVDHNCNSGSSETAEHEEFAPPRLDYQAPDMSILALTGKGRGSSSAQGYTKVTNPSCLRPMGADVPVAEVSDQVADGRASGQYAAVDVNPPCACGYPSMRLTVSMAGPNLGKSFYRCNECCFFQWEGSDVVEYYSNG